LVEEIGVARWRIRRIRTIETGLLSAEILALAAKSDTPDLRLIDRLRSDD